MDEVDLAQEREEAHLAASLAARKTRLKSPNGLCIWCKDEPVVAETAFCSSECDKHRREQSQRVV
ncbi:hypothetical protein GQQ23_11605 [Pantoea agglomerans]|uniref:hypothetical protein n=1 Tax=Enterobacter agglomerans TaxID=549 RepID=UPI0013CD8E0A|nr:hypothetical protein [Pantoea agglomerans]NEG62981.1 hypothetical protein [Pantoea agglomerans]